VINKVSYNGYVICTMRTWSGTYFFRIYKETDFIFETERFSADAFFKNYKDGLQSMKDIIDVMNEVVRDPNE
jgi:hypothetical protein